MEVTKKLLDNNKIEVTTVKEINRYEGNISYNEPLCRMFFEDLKEDNYKIWCANSREGFESLNSGENWEPGRESLEKDIKSFQDYLDENYGKDKYEAYALGAYIHSDVSFSISKSEDNRCRFDSGTIGFIGIPKNIENLDISILANNMSKAWNGYIVEYTVTDNLNGDFIDDINTLYYTKAEIQEWKERTSKEYGINWNEKEVEGGY